MSSAPAAAGADAPSGCQGKAHHTRHELLGRGAQAPCRLTSAEITKAQEKALAGQGSHNGNVTEGRFLLGFIIDEDLSVINRLC